jgi:hypothetical protein
VHSRHLIQWRHNHFSKQLTLGKHSKDTKHIHPYPLLLLPCKVNSISSQDHINPHHRQVSLLQHMLKQPLSRLQALQGRFCHLNHLNQGYQPVTHCSQLQTLLLKLAVIPPTLLTRLQSLPRELNHNTRKLLSMVSSNLCTVLSLH